MLKLYGYIVAEEFLEKPYIAPPAVTTSNNSLYFIEETVDKSRTASRVGDILREIIESEFKVFCNAAATKVAIKN